MLLSWLRPLSFNQSRQQRLTGTLLGVMLTLPFASAAQALTGTLTATDPDSSINVRRAPSTQAAAPNYGLPGDRVTVIRAAAGEGNYTWYYVHFPASGVEGWIRQDLIAVPPGNLPFGRMTHGFYGIGPTGIGLEVVNDRYRYYDEAGQYSWLDSDDIQYVRDGVIFDDGTYWCLTAHYPQSPQPSNIIFFCTHTGWTPAERDI